MLNQDTGFKIQHDFPMPPEAKFNQVAAKGSKLHSLLKEKKYPFYVDRIAGGITWHTYAFDRELIQEYKDKAAGYTVTKGGYVIKTKKSKGEIVDMWCIVTIEFSYEV